MFTPTDQPQVPVKAESDKIANFKALGDALDDPFLLWVFECWPRVEWNINLPALFGDAYGQLDCLISSCCLMLSFRCSHHWWLDDLLMSFLWSMSCCRRVRKRNVFCVFVAKRTYFVMLWDDCTNPNAVHFLKYRFWDRIKDVWDPAEKECGQLTR